MERNAVILDGSVLIVLLTREFGRVYLDFVAVDDARLVADSAVGQRSLKTRD